jgi:lysophospholipase L1-like esterase
MAAPLKIMAIGDSITHGVVDSGNTEGGGYRTELWNLFAADGLAVDFLGPRSSGPNHIDRNHAGMRGWRTDEILYGKSSESSAGNINTWLDSTQPDVVLLMAGTNDILQDYQLSTAPDRLSSIIDKITEKAPSAKVLVSSILPSTRFDNDAEQVLSFNAAIPGIVNTKVSQGKSVFFVDIFNKFNVNDLADRVHPTINGYTTIGNAWYEALSPLVGIDKTIRVQAENMTLTNYIVESDNHTALGRKLISLFNSGSNTGKASFNFAGASGNYDIVVAYFDENDGRSTLAVKLENTLLDQWTLDKNLGSGGADNLTLQRRTVGNGVFLNNGTAINIEGTANSAEWARVDYIEFIPKEAPNSPSTVSLSAGNISQGSGTSYTFNVTYADNDGINLSTIDNSDVRVTGPNNYSQLAQLVSFNSSSSNSTVTATYRINAPGGSWDTTDNGSYNVLLQAFQVADSKNNFIPAGELGSFQVNLVAPQSPIRLEAEEMQRIGYIVESNAVASGGKIASLYLSNSTTGTLNSVFTGGSGTYDVILRYFDEADGQSQLTTKIGGTQVDQRVLNQWLGSNSADSRTAVTRTIASGLRINQGDSVEIFGVADREEWARVDYIEFIPKEVSDSPSSVSLSAENISQGSGTSYTFNVTYADNDGINLSTIDNSDVRVTGPNNYSQLAQLVSFNSSSSNSTVTATYRINAPGGSWDTTDNGSYNVLLQAFQVADSKNNFIPAGELGSFQVNLVAPQSPIRLEAEEMQRIGYIVESNAVASGGKIASLYLSNSTTGTLNSVFTGGSGTYDVILRYFDEADGQSQLTTKIGGTQVDQRVLNQWLGSNSADSRTAVTRTIASGLRINQGDSVEILGVADREEWARVDYIEFVPITVASTNNTVSQDILINGGGNDGDVIVDFEDGSDRSGLYSGLQFNQLTISQGTGSDANNTFISVTETNEVLAVLLGVDATTITKDNFLFA